MSKLIDITGQRFGFWVAIRRAERNKNGQAQWLCRCECGRERKVTSNSLRSGNSTSCGCNHTPNLTNHIFGKLKVMQLCDKNSATNKRNWICQCDCGKVIIVDTFKLRNGQVNNCGCQKKFNKILQDSLSLLLKQENLLKQLEAFVEIKNLEKLSSAIKELPVIRNYLVDFMVTSIHKKESI